MAGCSRGCEWVSSAAQVHEREGVIFCKDCFTNEFAQVCAGCKKAITDGRCCVVRQQCGILAQQLLLLVLTGGPRAQTRLSRRWETHGMPRASHARTAAAFSRSSTSTMGRRTALCVARAAARTTVCPPVCVCVCVCM